MLSLLPCGPRWRDRLEISLPLAAWGLVLAGLTVAVAGQEDRGPLRAADNGPRRIVPDFYALTGATVIPNAGERLENATVVLRGGKIVSVGAGGVPAGATERKLDGLTVYPALVEPRLPIEVETSVEPDPFSSMRWRAVVHPERVGRDCELDTDLAESLRALGFGAVAITPAGGVVRGSASLVSLVALRDSEGGHPAGPTSRPVLRERAYQEFGYERASGVVSSLMGAIAIQRQTLFDARREAHSRPANPANPANPATTLFGDAWPKTLDGERPAARPLGAIWTAPRIWFDGSADELHVLRAAKVCSEFGWNKDRAVLVGSGYEFRRLDAVRNTGLPVLVPVQLPKAPAVDRLAVRERTTLRELWSWEQAATNAARLVAAGVDVAFTTGTRPERKQLFGHLRRAIEHGLPKERALAMLTTEPARMLGVEDQLGSITPGARANLLVVEGDLFDEDAVRRAVWIDGREHVLNAVPAHPVRGVWTVNAPGASWFSRCVLRKETGGGKVSNGEAEADLASFHRGPRQLEISFDGAPLGGPAGRITAHGVLRGKRWLGAITLPNGRRVPFTAQRTSAEPPTPTDEQAASEGAAVVAKPVAADAATELAARALPVPLGAFGRPAGQPALRAGSAPRVRIHSVTLWTGSDRGIIEDAVVLLDQGKVRYAGPSRDAPEGFEPERVVDGRNRLHVTPGLIDCHSHTGISRGVNEGSWTISSAVRIGDVVNPDDVNFYRQLAGGVTAANLLHGSANPIGGQNCVVKHRWGATDAEAMKLRGAKAGIKFALGENVKRARRPGSTRYPRSRMGVEAILRDRFTAAREYARDRAAWIAAGKPAATEPRRQLELEALAEILAGDRLVHCHSYRQDEILMLCRVAESFGFRIGTFQHGLECYKVAESVKQFARGASIFSDWWAYKFEVYDAIPFNAEILHKVGVPVSLNSDSNELARRLNTEAAKAVKYGGVDRHEALRMVTYNAAYQLAVEDRIGSLETGLDADLALWSGDPLSSMSRCVATFVDGHELYSLDRHRRQVQTAERERQRLIQKILTLDAGQRSVAGMANGLGREAFGRPGDCGCVLRDRFGRVLETEEKR